MKTSKKVVALMLSAAMCAGALAACGNSSDTPSTQAAGQTESSAESESTAKKADENTPLVVGIMELSEKFSSFNAETDYDKQIALLTQEPLLMIDRGGQPVLKSIDGAKVEYNGTEYTYTGIYDWTIEKEDSGKTTYTVKIRDDIKFSDGEALTADDIIFNYYVLCDPSFTGGATLNTQPITGLKDYIKGDATKIEGIKKVDDYTVSVTTDSYDVTTIYQLGLEGIAPLHYYGDESKYDYENDKFGFDKGDLSTVDAKDGAPMGAGPYKFVKYEKKTVYFEANEDYWRGAPKTKYVQYKEVQDRDKVTGVQQGTIDLTDPDGSKQTVEQVSEINGNGDVTGDVITTSRVFNLGYGFIGINADTVKVGDDPASEESKNLRKAFATVFAVFRDTAIDTYYGDAADVLNYPISNTSWAAPQKSDADYNVAYSKDVEGNALYTEGMSQEDKVAAAKEAALGYFEAAGYTVKDGKVTEAPKGAKMSYEIIIGGGGNGDHPAFQVLTDSKTIFDEIGITLNINDPSDQDVMWDRNNAGTQEMWVAAWAATADPDMTQLYNSGNIPGKGGTDSNYYHIQDADLDELIADARVADDNAYRKSAYKECMEIILDWAVEIPVYQRENFVIYSTERINTDTIVKDPTPFYDWKSEIYNIELN